MNKCIIELISLIKIFTLKILKYFIILDYEVIIFINLAYTRSKYIIQLLFAILFICNIVFCFDVYKHSKIILTTTINLNIMLSKYFTTKKKEKDEEINNSKNVYLKVEEGIDFMQELSKKNCEEMKKKDEEMKKKDETIRTLISNIDSERCKKKELKQQIKILERELENYKKFNSSKNINNGVRRRYISKSK